MLTRDSMKWFWDQYASVEERLESYASPLLAQSFANLPPAVILTAEYNVLRDEGEQYGNKLKAAGVDVEVTHVAGLIHGFIGDTNVVEPAREAIDAACASLARALNGDG